MNNIFKNSKLNLVMYIIATLAVTVLLGSYVIAANNNITVYGPSTIEEGQTLTFNVTFPENVENIWLSDGDIIKVGFSGNVKVSKVSDKNYTVMISNIYGVGAGKYITVNSGVGYIDGVPTDSVSSNVFEVTAKPVVDDNKDEEKPEDTIPDTKPEDNTNNAGDTNNKPNGNENNNNNNENNTKPENNKPSNNQKPTQNTNNNTNVNNNQTTTNNNQVNNSENNTEIVENETTEEVEEIRREIPNTGKIM